MEEEAAKGTGKVTGNQAVFLFAKETGKTECTKCKRVIKEYLYRMKNVRSDNELQYAVDYTGKESRDRAVPIADQAHDEHGK